MAMPFPHGANAAMGRAFRKEALLRIGSNKTGAEKRFFFGKKEAKNF
jgi:hypothetical protein